MGPEKKSASERKVPPSSTQKKKNTIDANSYEALYELVSPHIDSFDYFVQRGLAAAVADIDPVEIEHPSTGATLSMFLDRPVIQPPMKDSKAGTINNRLMPFECRQGAFNYSGSLTIDLNLDMNGAFIKKQQVSFGKIPIMLRSSICHLRGLPPQKLVALKEEATEMGGYFMTKGIERIIRMLILPKRNHMIALQRSATQNRGQGFSDKSVMMRCVRPDQTGSTMRLYYLNHGTAAIGFTPQKQEYVIPVGIVLKALIDTNDREIFQQLTAFHKEGQEGVKGAVGSQLAIQRAKIILEEVQRRTLLTRYDCLKYIGETVRVQMDASPKLTDAEVGEKLLRRYFFVHVAEFRDKFNTLIQMLQKLFAFVDGTCCADNPDSLQFQELLLPGQLFTIFLKDRLEDWLTRFKRLIVKEMQTKGSDFDIHDSSKICKLMDKAAPNDIGKRIEYLLATGSMSSNSYMDLQQFSGFSVVAEKLNFFRFISHFRSVHRGAFFAKQRTTTVRKLLPESWGFVCPVHTPDGEPCGLLTHLASPCKIATDLDKNNHTKDPIAIRKEIISVLVDLGMITVTPMIALVSPPQYLTVLLDGRVLGYLQSSSIPKAIAHLRSLKVDKNSLVPEDLEIGHVPQSYAGAYPGVFLFTTPCRFLRPVKQLSSGATELIAPFEQAYMEIVCPDGGDGGRTKSAPEATHTEIHPTNMLSVVASLTPWSDHNQSPRNMYQCQMGKQTMGFPSQNMQYRTDHKMYKLQTPQTPVAKNANYSKYCMDEFPCGVNAVVAVLSYTGYDMEDAMIMNKSAVERGLFHGQIYKTEVVDLTKLHKKKDGIVNVFARSDKTKNASKFLDPQGLPHIGQTMNDGDPYCSVLNTMTGETKLHKLKAAEPVVVDSVFVIGSGKDPIQKVVIKFRHERNPVIGDKHSSRHGQKGILSQLWPDVDMPFSMVTGMRPDIIINPHAFPSRMTMGMLIESLGGKAGVLDGEFVDSTPFKSSMEKPSEDAQQEDYPAVEQFGSQLLKHGFNYHGTEVMYSGVLGTELSCEIYMGVVYYQRLRHMVSDKFQCRSMGAVDQVTRQPVGGRKVGGGVRFGEMERDSLLAHGAAFLLHDRLHTCSDYHVADVCKTCGSLISTLTVPTKKASRRADTAATARSNVRKTTCRVCDSTKAVTKVAMPFVFRYLAAELAAMNVKLTLDVGHIE